MSNLSFGIIRHKVLEIVQKVKENKENYVLDMYLTSQGVDSLDMFDILMAIQEMFDLKVDIDQLEEEEWSTIDRVTQKITNILDKDNECDTV